MVQTWTTDNLCIMLKFIKSFHESSSTCQTSYYSFLFSILYKVNHQCLIFGVSISDGVRNPFILFLSLFMPQSSFILVQKVTNSIVRDSQRQCTEFGFPKKFYNEGLMERKQKMEKIERRSKLNYLQKVLLHNSSNGKVSIAAASHFLAGLAVNIYFLKLALKPRSNFFTS